MTTPAPNSSSVIQEVESWAGFVGTILEAVAGKATGSGTPATQTPAKSSLGINLGVDPLPELTAGFGTVTAVTNLIAHRDKELNTPDEVKAATAQKIQDLRDRATAIVAAAEQAGPKDAHGNPTPEWLALQKLLS